MIDYKPYYDTLNNLRNFNDLKNLRSINFKLYLALKNKTFNNIAKNAAKLYLTSKGKINASETE